jgi:hypothetical protein
MLLSLPFVELVVVSPLTLVEADDVQWQSSGVRHNVKETVSAHEYTARHSVATKDSGDDLAPLYCNTGGGDGTGGDNDDEPGRASS